MKERLFLVDAYALIFKSYYAFLSRPMRNREGLNTSAIFGFTKFIRDVIKHERPHYLGVAFDPKGGNFRNQLYPEYKANRSETPEDIILSVPYIKQILTAMHIPVLEVAGYEADDVIGTLSREATEVGWEVYMVTPDKDFGQLVSPSSFIYKQAKGDQGVEIVGPDRLREQYGVDDPRQIIDILALWGDAADNIPGVRGIGEKGAVKLVGEWGSVENILANADQIKGRQGENIREAAEQLVLAKKLATIDRHVPIEFKPETLSIDAPDCEALRALFTELDFRMFLRDMEVGGTAFSEHLPGQHPPCAPPAELERPRYETSAPRPVAPQPAPAKAAVQTAPDLFSQFEATAQPVTDEPVTVEILPEAQFETIKTTPHTYHTVSTAEELEKLVAELGRYPELCFDTETTGVNPISDRLVGISLSVKPLEAYYIPINNANRSQFAGIVKPLFENEKTAKIGQNIKFDIMVLRGVGITVRGFKYDTMILHYLLDPDSRHGMNALAAKYLNYAPIEIETLIGRGARQLTMDRVAVEVVAEYAAEDADVTFRLWKALWPQVVKEGFETLYRTIEEPLIDVLADIELAGVKIDTGILAQAGKQLISELAALEEQIRAIASDPSLNVNSARQLGVVLFEKLQIDPKPKKTKTKQYRTDEEYLASLADRHPIINMVLEYRGLKKLLSTYVEALPQLVNPKTGRIHTSFNQAVAATGRLSSTNPNLQNIPIRDERGREIRRAFVPSDDAHLLLSADYSQVELRLMAHFSGDPALIEAFEQGEDIHSATASRLYGIPLSEVTSAQRRSAKTVNFGIIYGISAFGLASRLGIPRTEAATIIKDYFAAYSGVKRYMDDVIARAHTDGFVTTLFGRRRPLPDIRSGNATVRSFAERNAINAPLQGSAADIIKLAMVAAHGELKGRGLQSQIILQVHDELVVDMLASEQEEVTEIITRSMEHAANLKVKLLVDTGVGKNWLEAH